jgi:hypothetical protein
LVNPYAFQDFQSKFYTQVVITPLYVKKTENKEKMIVLSFSAYPTSITSNTFMKMAF